MLFNSLSFAIFLPIVFGLYWFVAKRNLRWQNVLLLLASYYFYACWDWRFLFLLLFSTFLDFFTGLKIYEAKSSYGRKLWLWLSIIVNFGFLGVFKYYNFFALSFAEGLSHIGLHVDPVTLNIILPVGISFYTFHGISYVIDIYNKRISAERDFVEYAVFVSFFPLLVAGPIERATHLLPQIQREREFNYGKAVDGLRQILWGLVKKIVIADQCAGFANTIFNNHESYSGATLLLGALFFTFQIYGDFSGYSDIALGTARLFGIELLRNFAYPYFSRDIAEFWRRWHISLSSWFRDYLYIPLGGSKGGLWMKVRNTFAIFLVSGFWHGANWTFVAWGALNAIYFLPLLLTNSNRSNIEIVAKGRSLPSLSEAFGILTTFSITVLAWIFFRAATIKDAINYIVNLFTGLLKPKEYYKMYDFIVYKGAAVIILLTALFMLVEWLGREDKFALENLGLNGNKHIRRFCYLILAITALWYSGKEQAFIYFQF